jgi:hypothetical protein
MERELSMHRQVINVKPHMTLFARVLSVWHPGITSEPRVRVTSSLFGTSILPPIEVKLCKSGASCTFPIHSIDFRIAPE